MSTTPESPRRRVLVVTTWYPSPAVPVAGVFVRKDAQALALDHDVVLVHLAPPAAFASAPATEADGGVSVRRLLWDPRDPRTVVRAVAEVRRLLRGADVLHTMAFSSILPLLGLPVRTPWVHTEHWSGLSAPYSLSTPLRRVMPTLRHAVAAPDVVVPVCDFLARPIREVRRGPVEIIPCIVDQPATLVPRRADDARGGRLRLVAVGGLLPGKDPLTTVETLAELRRRGHDAHLTWVGGGPLRDDVLARAAALDVADHLTLTGPQTPQQVGTHLDDADVFLLPTRFDNFCVSGAEALAHGRPVVIGANGGQAEYVTPQVGALVAEQTPTAYADAVEDVLTRLAGTSAEQIAADVRARFTTDAVRADYSRLYDRLLGAATAGAGAPGGADAARGPESVDVIIAVHTADRAIERAVASVLADGLPDARALVVCHNIEPAVIADRLRRHGIEPGEKVVLLECPDGIPSPAGPFTLGLDASDTAYVAVMGSDDYLAPGALAAWLRHARGGAEAVIARVEHQDGGLVRTPPTRLARRARLDLRRDRLAYRTAPLGLLSADAVRRTGARFLAGVHTAEDLEFGLRLWAGAHGIVHAAGDPAYVVGADAPTRVTLTHRPVADDLYALRALVEGEWFATLPPATRRAVVVKLLRIHVFGAVSNRHDVVWTTAERRSLAAEAAAVLAGAPDAVTAFSRAEAALWEAITDPRVVDGVLVARSRARLQHGRPATVLTADPRRLLDAQAPLRLMAASALMR